MTKPSPWQQALSTQNDLRRDAESGKREDFEKFLKLAPDVPPLASDEPIADSNSVT